MFIRVLVTFFMSSMNRKRNEWNCDQWYTFHSSIVKHSYYPTKDFLFLVKKILVGNTWNGLLYFHRVFWAHWHTCKTLGMFISASQNIPCILQGLQSVQSQNIPWVLQEFHFLQSEYIPWVLKGLQFAHAIITISSNFSNCTHLFFSTFQNCFMTYIYFFKYMF